jgi:hypothetical protein
MLTLLALLAALLGPGPIMADNSGGGPVDARVAASNLPGGSSGQAATSGGATGGVPPVVVTVDDNSGGGPVDRK